MLSIIKLRLLRLKDDVLVFVLMTGMALVLTAVFGISFNTYRPEIMIVDEDKSNYSEMLIDELKTNNSFNFIVTDMDEASKSVQGGNVSVAMVVYDGFEESLISGSEVSLGFIKIKDDTMILTLQQAVTSIASKMAGAVKVADITSDYISSQDNMTDTEAVRAKTYAGVMDSWKYKNPMYVISTIAHTKNQSGYDGMKHTMIGFTLFFSMYTMVFSIGTILSDKQYKTWERMLISPVSKTSILGGSMVVAYLAGVVQMGVLILCGNYLLGVDWGNSMFGVLMVAAAFIFAVTSLGLMMSGFVKTQAQLGAIVPVVLTSTSMLGGCMWPLDIVNNKALLFLAELTPQKWAMQGIEGIASKGMGFEAAVFPTIVLMGMGAVFFIAGVKVLKTE
ncbi:ABC transporter permease [Sedimentibacter saalensis]|uniref:ABC-2 type transport system permease protein n=1 Tax=Sedimentibacter saalensis TaxID=130788 RepID=A0A562J3W9_9FIRM|nr:ABC transporter permease [Sedimentibacter saalensis]TWH77909.1 ABC-2 type transport system permease protein [Sedimentibacter saalensis]